MKHVLLGLLTVVLLAAAACSKRREQRCRTIGQYNGTVQVIKDCTGTYLRFQQKDYHVCNRQLLDNYGNGTMLTASFSRIASCSNLDSFSICNMYHANEGWVAINCLRSVD